MSGKVIAVVGTQWGDEGKGKIVDMLAEKCRTAVRFNGGNNAGHSVETSEGVRRKVHLLPASAYQPGMVCMLGNGMVMDPSVLVREIEEVKKDNAELGLIIDGRAHLILPIHKAMDQDQELSRGSKSLGTTKSGNGPAYADKMSRKGIRVSDLFLGQNDKGELLWPMLQNDQAVREVMYHMDLWGDALRGYVGDVSIYLNSSQIIEGGIIFAGAHGAMLDIDFGTYPYVTSSNCIASAVGTGAGFDPRGIDEVVGVVKAYSTRIGTGPFPTEIKDRSLADLIRTTGKEFGTTTGRPRRIGWLDLVALRHAIRVNGVDWITLTMLDVLSCVDEIKVCTRYEMDMDSGFILSTDATVPMGRHELKHARAVYETFDGWDKDLGECRTWGDLPSTARYFVQYLTKALATPIPLISVGPRRDQVIDLRGWD